MVDDTNIWTGRVLRDFLSSDDAWDLVEEDAMRTAFFRKIQPTNGALNWIYQPYVVARSFLTPQRRAVAMLRGGNYRAVVGKARKRVRRRWRDLSSRR